jgi:SAM-dependent methyltransferase
MITLPLAMEGIDIIGLDTDARSVEFGRRVFVEHGLDGSVLQALALGPESPAADVIIASEVLEHIPAPELDVVVGLLRSKVRPGGTLLVTVPNGYGWFEFEQFAWKHGLERFIAVTRIGALFDRLRLRMLGHPADDPYPNTLADDVSPHVQRFTLRSVCRLLERNGFAIVETDGSVMFSGPLTNTILRGFDPFLRVNRWLGSRFPVVASGFYVKATVLDRDAHDGPTDNEPPSAGPRRRTPDE